MCKRTLGVKKTLCSGTAKRRDVSERDTLGPMPAHVPSEAMEHATKKAPFPQIEKVATSRFWGFQLFRRGTAQTHAMIAVTWLVLAGCVVLALVFAIAADCVAASGAQRDEERLF